jgi:hypothetical protein
LVAFDTGNIVLVEAQEYSVHDGKFLSRRWSYTRDQYYHDSRGPSFAAKAKCRTAPLQEHYAALTRVHSRRSVDLDGLRAYLAVWRESFPVIIEEMNKMRWRKTRFVKRQLKHRALTKFFARVQRGCPEDGTEGLPITMVFADGKFPSSRRGVISTPTTSVTAAAVAVVGADNVYYESEYCSSKMDAACGHPLIDVYTTEPPTKRERRLAAVKQDRCDRHAARVAAASDPALEGVVPATLLFAPRPPRATRAFRLVWGLKYCAQPDCPDPAHRLKDRDINASRNITLAFLARVFGEPRPAYMCPVPREPGAPRDRGGPTVVYCLPPRR